MDELNKLTKLLPDYHTLEKIVDCDIAASYILKGAYRFINEIQDVNDIKAESERINTHMYLISSMADKFWERIHSGIFSEVPIEVRKLYALALIFKIFFMLYDNQNTGVKQVEKCSRLLDKAQLVGCTNDLYPGSNELIPTLSEFLDKRCDHRNIPLPIIAPLKRQSVTSDIPQYNCPDMFHFNEWCFKALKPALLLNIIDHWPALKKWNDLNYIMRIAGNRTVPIEIGKNYASEEWSQQLVMIRDFLVRQFGANNTETTEVEYLAQHELFDQIPALKSDIRVPDYCVFGEGKEDVDIKAWLGPKGTISPMHHDPKHNILCQVFGTKRIILAAPEDSENLYQHESKFLSNTSQLDAANLDLVAFPKAANVKFFNVTLQEGDSLYIPPKWWHYVRSEAPSFSVSFWWE